LASPALAQQMCALAPSLCKSLGMGWSSLPPLRHQTRLLTEAERLERASGGDNAAARSSVVIIHPPQPACQQAHHA
jgi:hypothetical protein